MISAYPYSDTVSDVDNANTVDNASTADNATQLAMPIQLILTSQLEVSLPFHPVVIDSQAWFRQRILSGAN